MEAVWPAPAEGRCPAASHHSKGSPCRAEFCACRIVSAEHSPAWAIPIESPPDPSSRLRRSARPASGEGAEFHMSSPQRRGSDSRMSLTVSQSLRDPAAVSHGVGDMTDRKALSKLAYTTKRDTTRTERPAAWQPDNSRVVSHRWKGSRCLDTYYAARIG